MEMVWGLSVAGGGGALLRRSSVGLDQSDGCQEGPANLNRPVVQRVMNVSRKMPLLISGVNTIAGYHRQIRVSIGRPRRLA